MSNNNLRSIWFNELFIGIWRSDSLHIVKSCELPFPMKVEMHYLPIVTHITTKGIIAMSGDASWAKYRRSTFAAHKMLSVDERETSRLAAIGEILDNGDVAVRVETLEQYEKRIKQERTKERALAIMEAYRESSLWGEITPTRATQQYFPHPAQEQ